MGGFSLTKHHFLPETLILHFCSGIQDFKWKSIKTGKTFSYFCGSDLGVL